MNKEILKLERLAEMLWKFLLDNNISCGHCKRYDPLKIHYIDGEYVFRSYVFDYGDGSRSRNFKTLEEGHKWLINSFVQWLSEDVVE